MNLLVRYRNAPIKHKLMLIGLLAPGLALLTVGLIITVKDIAEWRSRAIADLTTYAEVVGTNAAPAMMFDDRRAAADTLAALAAQPDIVHAVIHDKDGVVFATYDGPGHTSHPMPSLAPREVHLDWGHLVIAQSIRFKGETQGIIYVESELKRLYDGVIRSIGLVFLATLGAFILTAWLFTRLQRAIVGPIENLALVMQAVSDQQDYAVRVAVQGTDEVGVLALTFNHMLERIQQRDAELARHRDHLETEVAQRTADLRDVNRQLEQLNGALEEKVAERTRQLVDTQDELVRKEKLAVLGQVAGSVGHELRNPLGVMSNAVYFLQTVLSEADPTTKEYLGIIKDEIVGAERIVADLLDSVRTKPPNPEKTGVNELITRTLHKCTVPDGVSVTLDIPDNLPPMLVDPLQIHQVFRNLISNGIDAMAEGGTLEIRASEDRQAKAIIVSVRDGGCGMTPEHLAKLFQPLYTTKARGIGLGLVVVKNLIQANGGTVAVQSERDVGTTFTVTLPDASQNPQPSA
ncbi:ATP-binding protein [Denitratisoma oestradiolicum]|uniref:histidine kinase n=1 Tax=Denitratisoma oestradiolicum TaxID=311182 RepID=A0A6S6XYT8_9PROT|nr:ATP-binding protein [Denitratisoma oestradiolicum]TWO80243.1 hypothetical protein CBW56_10540 [Denitratisoma oestradiolicum]CAB1369331.1 putative Histidine kinase [Denitratisoma oestradiolicum]